MSTSRQRTGIAGVVLMLSLAGPLVGAVTLAAAVILGGRSIEGSGPASAMQYLALVILVVWGAVSYAALRRTGATQAVSAAGSLFAVVWSVGAVTLFAAIT